MKRSSIICFLGAVLIIFAACNKEKRFSKRFIEPGIWEVSELSVNGVSDTLLPNLNIPECDIYEDSCTSTWQTHTNESADFYWQFSDKGDSFTIKRKHGVDSSNFITHISEVQCYNYSGTYSVVKAKKKEMIFESESTVGYLGQKVKIVLERQE